jgi:radical SAM superfamily enzyme YgiQ (UPF0313 family)
MKILLINPPCDQLLVGNNPEFLDEHRGYNPPLGLLYLAAAVVEDGRHEVTVLDSLVEEMTYKDIGKAITDIQPDVAGITTLSFTLLDVVKTVKLIKELCPNTKIVLGGPHVYLYPKETIELDGVDYLIVGEGENTFVKFLEFLEGNCDLPSVPGLVYMDQGKLIKNEPGTIAEIDNIAFPSRQLVPYQKYNSLLFARNPVTTMFTSRGCPYQCTFCDRPHLGKKFRAHSAEYVLREMENCIQLGIKDFIIYDDTFTVNRDRIVAICRGILQRKWDVAWDVRTRLDTVDEELLKLMKKARCQGIHYGIEAGTEKVLKVLNKGITLDLAAKVFGITRKVGIKILAYFMIGCPTETREDIAETFRMAKKLNPDFIHLTIFSPFPGTQIYFDGLKNGIIPKDIWGEFARNPTPDFVPPHWNEFFSRKELEKILIEGYQDFYGRSWYIFKQLLKVRTVGDLKRKAQAGLRVLSAKKQ